MLTNPRIRDLERRVQSDPSSVAFAALAEEYRRLGRFDDAIETCRRGLERYPTYLSARVTLGLALVELNRLDEAEAELQQVFEVSPENLAATRAIAEIHRRRYEGSSNAELGMRNAELLIPSPIPNSACRLPNYVRALERLLDRIVAARESRSA